MLPGVVREGLSRAFPARPGIAAAACRSLTAAFTAAGRAGAVLVAGAAGRAGAGRLDSGLPEPFGGQLGERGVEFDAGEPAAEGQRRDAGRAGAAERVEDNAAWLAAGLDTASGDVEGVGGEARSPVRAGVDGPDVARVAPLG